jgi:hypothetical protein
LREDIVAGPPHVPAHFFALVAEASLSVSQARTLRSFV